MYQKGFEILRRPPVSECDSRLAEDLFHKWTADHLRAMRVWNMDLNRTLPHEVVAPTGNGTLIPKAAKPPYQFAATYRFHPLRRFHSESNPANTRYGIVIPNFQNQPLLQHFLQYFPTPVEGAFVRPNSGDTADLSEVRAIFKSLVARALHGLLNVTAKHQPHNTAMSGC